MALHAISLLTHRRLIEDIERHRADAHLVVLPPPCPLNIQPIDFSHADELIDRALRRRARVPRRRRRAPPADPHAHAPTRTEFDEPGSATTADQDMRTRRTTASSPAPLDPTVSWRRCQLVAAGFAPELATDLAGDCGIDLHALLELVDRGCPPEVAARILAPLDDCRRRC